MTLNITDEIKAAYVRWLDEAVDADFSGRPILRRATHPYTVNEYGGLIDFAAGWQAAAEKLAARKPEASDGWRTSADGLSRVKIAPDAAAPMVPSESRKLLWKW